MGPGHPDPVVTFTDVRGREMARMGEGRQRDRRPRAGAGAEWRALAPAPSAECVSESHGWGQGSHRDSVRAGSVARAAPGGAECDQGGTSGHQVTRGPEAE